MVVNFVKSFLFFIFPPQKVEASFQAATMMEMHVEGGMMTQHMAHKTPPRVPPKPTSKSPPSFVSKVSGGRQQSPSPVRHVKGPTPQPVRYAYWWILQMIQKWQKWWSVDFRNEKWMWSYCKQHLCCLQTCFSLHQSVCLSHQTSQVSFTDQETGENTKFSCLRIHPRQNHRPQNFCSRSIRS